MQTLQLQLQLLLAPQPTRQLNIHIRQRQHEQQCREYTAAHCTGSGATKIQRRPNALPAGCACWQRVQGARAAAGSSQPDSTTHTGTTSCECTCCSCGCSWCCCCASRLTGLIPTVRALTVTTAAAAAARCCPYSQRCSNKAWRQQLPLPKGWRRLSRRQLRTCPSAI